MHTNWYWVLGLAYSSHFHCEHRWHMSQPLLCEWSHWSRHVLAPKPARIEPSSPIVSIMLFILIHLTWQNMARCAQLLWTFQVWHWGTVQEGGGWGMSMPPIHPLTPLHPYLGCLQSALNWGRTTSEAVRMHSLWQPNSVCRLYRLLQSLKLLEEILKSVQGIMFTAAKYNFLWPTCSPKKTQCRGWSRSPVALSLQHHLAYWGVCLFVPGQHLISISMM